MKTEKKNLFFILVLAAGCGGPTTEVAERSGQAVAAGNIYSFGTLAHSGSCMDARSGGTADGTQIQEWSCNGTGAQSFELEDTGSGSFYILNTLANKCVDIAAAGTADGTKIQLWDCNQSDAQIFVTQDAGNGFVYFVNPNSNKCLDVQADSPNDGTVVQLFECNQTNAQKWNPTVIGGAPSGGSTGSGSGSGSTGSGWTLTWSDEFNGPDGSAVDPSKWNFDTGGSGWGNNELEYYASGTANAVVSGGSLVITATSEGASNYTCWYGPCQYTSARLNTAGKFSQEYGRFEARIKIPQGQGVWPAFWLLGDNIGSVGWPACGEIDAMENVGSTPNSSYGTTHGPGPGSYPATGLRGTYNASTALADDYHVYATEWNATSVSFYVDGTLYWTVEQSELPAGATWVWDQPFYILLNFAVGGNWPGSPDASAFPQQMLVDYVRVYEPSGVGSGSSGSGGGTNTPPGGGSYVASGAPNFGPNVLIFDPSMGDSNIQSQIDGVFNAQETNQFGSERYAYFFKPGSYNLNVQLGFYMEALGLGTSPDDVSIAGAVQSTAVWNQGNATVNFWRLAENLSVTPSASINPNDMWAISQGTALRRFHSVTGGMILFNPVGGPNEWASGGFIADSKVDGIVVSGSQQQFLTRNVNMGQWVDGVWNMVFVGDDGDPTGTWPTSPYTFVDSTPTIREKPYLTIDSGGNYAVVAPTMMQNTQGTTWESGSAPSTTTPISAFYIAQAGVDTADTINAALNEQANLILTPGVYHLASPITVTRPGTIVLGLGVATLIPDQGTAALTVADVDAVTVAGILFDAGPVQSSTLLLVGGSAVSATSHAESPTALFDITCRVGGAAVGTTSSCVTINSNDVFLDNAWLWRADHGTGVGWNVNVANNGLIVNGANVTAYGLFVEHFEQYQTLWNGDGGKIYFYQSEIPYDVPSQAAWTPGGGVNGYSSIMVADGVTHFDGRGLGIYCYFDNNVVLDNAIVSPTSSGVTFEHIVTQWFENAPNSAINHIINGTGLAVNASNTGATTAY
jgi:beta-glucanase (GH16 family)